MKPIILACSCLLAFVASPVNAQPRDMSGWFADADLATLYQGNADLDGRPGGFDMTRVYAAPGIGYAWSPRNRASLSLGVGRKAYGFDDGAALAGGAPWRSIREISVSAPVFLAATEQIQVIAIPSVRWNAESGADLDDGRTEGILAGASYRFSDTLAIGPGIGWFSELGDDASIFPILLIDWDITQRLNLSTGRGLAASQGPGLSLTYAVTDNISAGVTGRYESARFRLDDTGPASDGIGEDESFPLLATLRYAMGRRFSVNAFAGVEMGGQLALYDSAGNTIDETDYETAPVVGLTFRALF